MSAPAIKSSMPGVGTPASQTGHTGLPMNIHAQKMVQSADQSSGNAKPLQTPNLNYVPLQPSGQPLSLIQEHRPPYQPPFANNIPMDQQQQSTQQQSNLQPQQHQALQQPTTQQQQPTLHKEAEHQQDSAKLVQNGKEQSKAEKDKSSNAVPTSSAPTTVNTTLTPLVPPLVTPQITVAQTTPATTTTTSPAKPTTAPSEPPPKLNSSSVAAPATVASQQQSDVDKTKTTETLPVKSTEHQAVPPVQKKTEETKVPAATQQKVETSSTPSAATGSPSKAGQQSTPATKSEDVSTKSETSPQKTAPKVTKSESPEKADAKELKSPPRTPAKRKQKDTKEVKTPSYITETTAASSRSRRARVQTTPYQSPIVQYPTNTKNVKQTPSKSSDDKLIVFYKNEFLAVRNPEGSFYVCQAMQNIYKTSKRIRIRWLSQDKTNGDIYSPDFYDHTDFDCILTNLNLNKKEKNRYELTKYDLLRTENILKKAMDVEAGIDTPNISEDHPFGLDISLYKDEAQLQQLAKEEKNANKSNKSGKSKAKRPRKKAKDSDSEEDDDDDIDDSEDENESSSDSDEDAIKSADSSRKSAKKRNAAARSGALAQMQTTPKGPTRAERALNRSKGPIGPSTSGMAGPSGTSSVKKAPAEPKKVVEQKKPVANATPKPAPRRITGAAPTPTTPVATTPAPQTPTTSDSKAVSGRPKRAASNVATTPTQAAQEESTPNTSSARKKPRGRA